MISVQERSDLKNLLTKLKDGGPITESYFGKGHAGSRDSAFLDSVRAGAIGYVLHDASAEILISSVRAVLNGEAACPARMIVSLYKYIPGSGIACPSFARENRQAAFVANAEPRALRFFLPVLQIHPHCSSASFSARLPFRTGVKRAAKKHLCPLISLQTSIFPRSQSLSSSDGPSVRGHAIFAEELPCECGYVVCLFLLSP